MKVHKKIRGPGNQRNLLRERDPPAQRIVPVAGPRPRTERGRRAGTCTESTGGPKLSSKDSVVCVFPLIEGLGKEVGGGAI